MEKTGTKPKSRYKADTFTNRAVYDVSKDTGRRKCDAAIQAFDERVRGGAALTEDEKDKREWLISQLDRRTELLKLAGAEKLQKKLDAFKKKEEAIAAGAGKTEPLQALKEEPDQEVEKEQLVESEDDDDIVEVLRVPKVPAVGAADQPLPDPPRQPAAAAAADAAVAENPAVVVPVVPVLPNPNQGEEGEGGDQGNNQENNNDDGGDPDRDSDDDDEMPGRPKGNEINQIPMFDGTTPDPDRWLDAVVRVANAFFWDVEGENDRRARAACLRMEGAAGVWLESMTRMGKLNDAIATWDAFKTAFRGRFRPLDEAIRSTEAIMDLKMKQGEKVQEFADRIMIGVDKKNEIWSEEARALDQYAAIRNQDLFSFMCAGLDSSLRKIVMGGSDPPTTFDGLITKACQVESAMRAKHSIQELVEGIDQLDVNERSDGGSVKETNSQSAKIATLEKQIEALQTGIKCWYCEGPHMKANCPKLKQQGTGSGGRGGQRGQPRGGPRGRGGFRGGFQGNWRGGFRGNRGGGGWRGRGGQRGRGFGSQPYFSPHLTSFGQYYQPRYPGVHQIQQVPQGQQYPPGNGNGFQGPPPNPNDHQQYEIVDLGSGNY